MLNVTKKLKLFVLFTELLSMIWLRRFIAIIALFIFSALSAWAQTQVNSPEGPYDCTEVANGKKVRDKTQYKDCCLPTQMVFCGGCVDHRTTCEKDPYFGCGTDATINDSRCGCGRPGLVDYNCGCGNPAPGECGCNLSVVKVCGECGGSFNACGDCSTTDQGCGCGQPAAGACGCNLSIVNQGCGCGNGTSCFGCDNIPNSGKTDQGCGCGVLLSSYRECVAFNGFGGADSNGIRVLLGSGRSGNVDQRHCWFFNGTNYTFCGKTRLTGKGCFDPDTELLLEGGRTAKARNVRVGDRLYNPVTRSSTAVTEIISGPETEAMIEVGFKGYMLKVTRQHPVLTTAGMKRAANLTTKDVVLDALGVEQIIEYVQQAPILPNQKVINFTLDSDSTDYRHRLLVGNNVVSGDLIVQNGHLEGE